MPIQILMPALSPTMTEGKIVAWHRQPGDPVQAGDVMAEIETDKATMEIEAVDDGTMGRILVAAGTESVAVNTLIALLLEEGEGDEVLDAVSLPAAAPPPATVPPPDAPKPATATPAAPPRDGERVFASPLARRMAHQAGLELAAISGTGPNGRVVKVDIEAAIAATSERPQPSAPISPAPVAAAAPPAPPATAQYEDRPNSTMRKVIARRLAESKQTAPHFYLSMDCELDALLEVRRTLNARLDDTARISVNDMVIRAAALALAQVPEANASWSEDATRVYGSVDISVAVAIDGGLITPVIRNAQHKGLAQIAAEMKELAARARDGKLAPEEYQGGTFSISNLGMYGVREFAAVINPPQGAILAVGEGSKRPVVRDDALAIATVMTCTLSVDHRVVDGAVGARLLAAFKRLVEDPLLMLL
ncbi:MAG: pyruvate dehydrogenase complex dihydrolipoamide acetyltransferase [Alphaproteobacteria bacterium]|nr:pyruvate dehydrogenase complex dihydrolipoamide acetyltransferase [Alphaproteobacteria bacterium]